MPIPFDPSSVIDLADKLGIIQTVKDKLLRQPQTAADKLVTVLAELSKIYAAIETELVRYLSLSFDPPKGMAEERAVLLTLEGGQLRLRASESRGHCHKIWNIYDSTFAAGSTMSSRPTRLPAWRICFSGSAMPTPKWSWPSRI